MKTLRNKLTKLGIAALALPFAFHAPSSLANTAEATVQIEVADSTLTLTNTAALDFGEVIVYIGEAEATLRLNPSDSSLTPTNGANNERFMPVGGTPQAAEFEISGAPNSTVNVTSNTATPLTLGRPSGNHDFTLDDLRMSIGGAAGIALGAITLDGNGDASFSLGGTLTSQLYPATLATTLLTDHGTYSATLQLQVDYD